MTELNEVDLVGRHITHRGTSLTVSVPAKYIVPGTPFAANRSRSVEFSSSFDIIFAATDGAAVPEA